MMKDLAGECRVGTESLDEYFVVFSTQFQPRRPGTGSRFLRSHCLSALQELVGRNGLPTLLSSNFKNRFYYLLIFVLKFISVYEKIMNDLYVM